MVRDHDHLSGQYIGPACNRCNMLRRVNPSLQVVFHNLKGYDMHHILKYAVGNMINWELDPIAVSTEKFLALNVAIDHRKINFIDSLQFLSESLSVLADNLNVLPLTESIFPKHLVKGKGFNVLLVNN